MTVRVDGEKLGTGLSWRGRPEHPIRRLARASGLRKAYQSLQHRGLKPTDVFLASYPKSGNTWLKFVLADLALEHEVGYREAEDAVPNVGSHRQAPGILPDGGRLLKTHEPHRKAYRRSILIIRDPRDVALSYQRFLTGFGLPYEDLSEFVSAFVQGRVGSYGSWLAHTSTWLSAGNHKVDLHVVCYEDLKLAPVPEFAAAAEFLGLETSGDRVVKAVERNDADRMRSKEAGDKEFFAERGWNHESTSFVGNATQGGWRNQLSAQDLELLEPSVRLYESIVEPFVGRYEGQASFSGDESE